MPSYFKGKQQLLKLLETTHFIIDEDIESSEQVRIVQNSFFLKWGEIYEPEQEQIQTNLYACPQNCVHWNYFYCAQTLKLNLGTREAFQMIVEDKSIQRDGIEERKQGGLARPREQKQVKEAKIWFRSEQYFETFNPQQRMKQSHQKRVKYLNAIHFKYINLLIFFDFALIFLFFHQKHPNTIIQYIFFMGQDICCKVTKNSQHEISADNNQTANQSQNISMGNEPDVPIQRKLVNKRKSIEAFYGTQDLQVTKTMTKQINLAELDKKMNIFGSVIQECSQEHQFEQSKNVKDSCSMKTEQYIQYKTRMELQEIERNIVNKTKKG